MWTCRNGRWSFSGWARMVRSSSSDAGPYVVDRPAIIGISTIAGGVPFW